VGPAGLPDGRILFSQSVGEPEETTTASYRLDQAGRISTLTLRRTALRYELRVMRPDGTDSMAVPLEGSIGDADVLDAVAVVVRKVGSGPGEWRRPVGLAAPLTSDNPLEWNVPRGLLTGDGQPAYPWSQHSIDDIELVTVENPNVYANPPLGIPLVNNSPPFGSVAFADIYIDANQFTGASYRADAPDDQVRAVKWITVPVDARGRFVASAPADVPMFIVLRDKEGRVVRGGNRTAIAIAQGNSPGRAGRPMFCVGCHMGHASGSLDADPLAVHGWTNVAPAARVTASSGEAARATDRRGYVPMAAGGYQDRTPPWVASRGSGEWLRLEWELPVAVLDVRLTGAEPGTSGAGDDTRLSGELVFFLGGEEVARQPVPSVMPLTQGATTVKLPKPVAADRVELRVSETAGRRAALSEIEVIGQGASPQALAGRPASLALPLIGR
jgi:hypothetical protein